MSAARHRQRGVALLVALLVVALAVILIAALLDRGELAFARTRNALRGEQAEAYAQGLEAYAAQVLRTVQSEASGPDTNASPWAVPMPAQPVPGGVIGASMRDRNGCFNLNNLMPKGLANPGYDEWHRIFGNLLQRLGLGEPIRTAVEGWLDPERARKEANVYLAQAVPYRPRGGLFAHASELRLVRGIDGDAYARLAPHICALPPGTLLNVNTATLPLLWSLVDGMTRADAEKLWNGGHANYPNVDDFLRAPGSPGATSLRAVLDTTSTYFLARGDVVLDEVPFTFYSLIERPRNGPIRVLQRSRGSDAAADAPVAAAALAAGRGVDDGP